MKLIETYKKVINHQTGYTLIGEEAFAELGNLKRLQTYVFPDLDKLEIGKEVPENLNQLSNGLWIDLSYNFGDRYYPLILHVKNGILLSVRTDKRNPDEDCSEQEAIGYYSFMD